MATTVPELGAAVISSAVRHSQKHASRLRPYLRAGVWVITLAVGAIAAVAMPNFLPLPVPATIEAQRATRRHANVHSAIAQNVFVDLVPDFSRED